MPKSVLFDKETTIRKVTELFWQQGYNGTSMQDLVEATGLNRSSIYNTYGDKFNLFIEALNYYSSSQNSMLSTIKSKAKSPKEVIEMLFNSIWSQLNESNTKGCFFSNCTTELANSDERVLRFLEENHFKMIDMFTDLIVQAQQQGQIDSTKNAKALANYLFSNLHGLRVTSMIDSNKSTIKGIADQVLSSL